MSTKVQNKEPPCSTSIISTTFTVDRLASAVAIVYIYILHVLLKVANKSKCQKVHVKDAWFLYFLLLN